MSVRHDLLGIESMLDRPAMPDARHGGSGVDEDSIHIKEKRGAANLIHSLTY